MARNVHVPAASSVTVAVVRASPSTREDVAPDTVHTLVVVLATTTGAVDRPPVTVTGIGASPKVAEAMAGNDSVCAAFATSNDRLTGSAARWLASPSCSARIVQVPTATRVTVAVVRERRRPASRTSPTGCTRSA